MDGLDSLREISQLEWFCDSMVSRNLSDWKLSVLRRASDWQSWEGQYFLWALQMKPISCPLLLKNQTCSWTCPLTPQGGTVLTIPNVHYLLVQITLPPCLLLKISTVWECRDPPGQRTVNNAMSCTPKSQKICGSSFGIWKFVCALLVYYCKVWSAGNVNWSFSLCLSFKSLHLFFLSSSFSVSRSHVWCWNNAASVSSSYFSS